MERKKIEKSKLEKNKIKAGANEAHEGVSCNFLIHNQNLTRNQQKDFAQRHSDAQKQ